MVGAERLRDNEKLKELLTKQKQSGRLYAAICASPGINQSTIMIIMLINGKRGADAKQTYIHTYKQTNKQTKKL